VSGWWVITDKTAAGRAGSALSARGIEYELSIAPSSEAVGDVVLEGVGAGYSNFASVGGDGAASLVLNGLMTHEWVSPPTMAILPTGDGGDFIRTFALPRDLEGAAGHLADDQRYPTDVGLIQGTFGSRYFLNGASAGVWARAIATASRLPDRVALWVALAGLSPAAVRAEVDERTLEGDLVNVIVANGQFARGGLNVAPRATVQDGVFDVQLISGPRRNAAPVMARMARGAHLTHRSVRRTKGAEIVVECPDSWQIEVDGMLLGAGSFSVEVLPHAIHFKI